MITKTIKISNCSQCPFANYHYDAGRKDNCNLGGGDDLDSDYPVFPETGVLRDCPLKENKFKFKLIEQ